MKFYPELHICCSLPKVDYNYIFFRACTRLLAFKTPSVLAIVLFLAKFKTPPIFSDYLTVEVFVAAICIGWSKIAFPVVVLAPLDT